MFKHSLLAWQVLCGLVLLLVACLLSLSQGSSQLGWDGVRILAGDLAGWLGLVDMPDLTQHRIIWQVRLPRVFMAVIAGSGLSVAGATIQALVRNPMADPWLLGVSSGASLGAVTVMVFGLGQGNPWALHLFAFGGACLAAAVVYQLSQKDRHLSTFRLILMGLALSFACNAVTQILIFASERSGQIRGILFWTLGSLGGVEQDNLWIPGITVLGCSAYLYSVRHQLNIMTMPDVKAFSLGIPLRRFRRNLFLVSALLTSVIVSVCGAIGFVGLIIPHLIRLWVGGNYRVLIPLTLIFGAFFMVSADTLARTVFAPEELPLGVLTAILGSPVLMLLLRRSHG